MKLELKLALIGALSRIIIFALFLIALELIFNQIASRHTDRDLVKMKDKTMAIINRVGIRSFLKEEQDSAYASYNLLKEEFITLNLTPDTAVASQSFSSVSREIEGEEFDYRILTYNFNSGRQYYMLEIGRNVQLISSFKQAIKMISVVTILIVLLITILIDLGIYEALLRPLNNVIIPKLRKTTSPETFEYSELKTSTTDFAYLNKVINDLMHKVSNSMATQKRFIADVSHELMTPVSVIGGKMENLAIQPALPPELASDLIEIQQHMSRLQQIIKALLLISRIENDQFPKNESFILSELVDEILEDIGERASMSDISMDNRVDRQILLTGLNRPLIRIMLFNLVSNAIKYNREGGYIRIDSQVKPDGVVVSVEDSGIGINAEQLPVIFDRFRRIRPELTEGFGLGLSIVRAIADYHRLVTGVSSEIGRGSVFTVTFPLNSVKIG